VLYVAKKLACENQGNIHVEFHNIEKNIQPVV